MNRAFARRVLSSYVETPVIRLLARLGISPNLLTILGLLGAGATAYLLSVGRMLPGGLVLLASGVLDLLDGALARSTGRATRFGALLDSVVDRAAEAVVLLGLLVFFVQRPSTEGVVLAYLALAGSVMVSYLRARAEGLGIECKVGIMTRSERVAVLSVGLVVGYWWLNAVLVALGVIASLTMVTSAQRLFHIWRTLDRHR